MRALLLVLCLAACGKVNSNTPDASSAVTCSDGLKNGQETDVDCGGADCGPCADQKACESADDCQSKVCTNQVCLAATCDDDIQNADEVDVDCAGHCGDGSCATGQKCTESIQCEGRLCDIPSGMTEGTCIAPKRVFATNAIFSGGQIGGLTGADAKCQGAAVGAGLTGTYKAWLSDVTGSPSTRFTQSNAPYVRVDGILVANNWADLIDGELNAPIIKTEINTVAASEVICNNESSWVWTNTQTDGTMSDAGSSCVEWSVNTGGSIWGRVTDVQGTWTSACSGGAPVNFCGKRAPLYCFEQ